MKVHKLCTLDYVMFLSFFRKLNKIMHNEAFWELVGLRCFASEA